jgi:hypothetical protein
VIITNDFDFTFNENVKPILLGAKTAQSYYRKNSVSALAKDLILQYPVLLSADIPYENEIVIAKALELQYAAFQIAVLSADTAFGVDPSQTAGVRDLISRYHSNNDTPNMVDYAGNMIYNAGALVSSLANGLESAEITLKKATEIERGHTNEFLDSLWEKPLDALEMTSLNDMYNPAKALIETVSSVADSAEKMIPATEVQDTSALTILANNPASKFDIRATGSGKPNGKGGFTQSRYADDLANTPRNASASKDFRDVAKEFSRLEPTMIELEFFVRNGDSSAMRRAVIGVSAMPRSIPSDVMRTNIIKALQHDNTGFKFIAWTRGEQKVVKDFIFNVSRIKEDAMAKSKYDRWFAALRKRKRNSKAFKGYKKAINPLTSLVITKNDAALIKQTSGFDLTDETVAAKLMDSLYLLCFMVVDTDTGLVSTLLDGQQYFTETTIEHLKKASKSKDNDLTNLREMLKLLGR